MVTARHLAACKEFIEALEVCHADSWAKFTGGCNSTKIQLNKCLHAQSMKQAAANREKAKITREKTEQAWQQIREEQS
ncbi:hypothetical protein BDW22DRAFT_1334238 [Trametopsis cervina]|nr:hypothetical protein BDW22DRAFT_1334238 [Trametopsis cervina]